MSINSFIPAFAGGKSSNEKARCSISPPPHSQKNQILTGITDGVHLLTLLGMACKLIGELTDDPAFYEQARRRVRCRGMAENHLPSKIERWEQLQEEIKRTNGNYHLETDSTCKQLFYTMTMSLCRHAEELERQLRADGMTWTKEEGWRNGNGGRV